MKNCPNCGAPVFGTRCDYCGTSFTDEAELQNRLEELKQRKLELEFSYITHEATNSIVRGMPLWGKEET